MRKFTTKIIGDMMMNILEEHNKKLHKLNNDFRIKSEALININDLLIKFPNIQLSEDYLMMWTPEVNHLINKIIVKEKINNFNHWIQISLFTFIDNIKIFGVIKDKWYKEDDTYKYFTISSQGIERKNWQNIMRNSNITEFIIHETERKLYDLINEQNLNV